MEEESYITAKVSQPMTGIGLMANFTVKEFFTIKTLKNLLKLSTTETFSMSNNIGLDT